MSEQHHTNGLPTTTSTDIRHATHPDDLPRLLNHELRERFVAGDLFADGSVRTLYSHHDRMVIGGAVLDTWAAARTRSSRSVAIGVLLSTARARGRLHRRRALVTVDGTAYRLANKDVLYVSRGSREVTFAVDDAAGGDSSLFLASALAHVELPTSLVRLDDANAVPSGQSATSNERTIYQHLHEAGVRTAQLVVGITVLAPGSVWNTMPCHLHDRRTEIYLYFDLGPDARDCVNHVMGEPHETRRLTVADRQAVISPSWSVHYGAGTSNYSFVWVMAGENQAFADMDLIASAQLS